MINAYYNIHNIVKIKFQTAKSEITKEYEHYLKNFRVEKFGNTNIEVMDFNQFSLPNDYFNISYNVYGFQNGIYNKKDLYAVKFKNNKITLYINEANICFNALIEYILLQNKYTFIHGAGVSYKDKGIIFPGFGGVGKTLLISRLRKKNDIKFFGDDYVLVKDNGKMFSYPADFSIYNYHFNFFPELKETSANRKIKRAKYERILVNMIKDFPIKKIFKKIARLVRYDFLKGGQYLKIPAQDLIPKEKIGTETNLEYAVFLSKYNGSELKIKKMETEDMSREILGVLFSEWCNTIPIYHSLCCSGVFDFAEFVNNIKFVITSCFSSLTLYKVLIPIKMNNKEYLDKIERFLDREIFSHIEE